MVLYRECNIRQVSYSEALNGLRLDSPPLCAFQKLNFCTEERFHEKPPVHILILLYYSCGFCQSFAIAKIQHFQDCLHSCRKHSKCGRCAFHGVHPSPGVRMLSDGPKISVVVDQWYQAIKVAYQLNSLLGVLVTLRCLDHSQLM